MSPVARTTFKVKFTPNTDCVEWPTAITGDVFAAKNAVRHLFILVACKLAAYVLFLPRQPYWVNLFVLNSAFGQQFSFYFLNVVWCALNCFIKNRFSHMLSQGDGATPPPHGRLRAVPKDRYGQYVAVGDSYREN